VSAQSNVSVFGRISNASRSLTLVLIKVIITVLLLWLCLRGRDFPDFFRTTQKIGSAVLIMVMGAAALQVLLGIYRWHAIIVMLGGQLPWRSAARALLLERLFNQAVPGLLGGDAARGWVVVREGTDTLLAVSSIILDRLVAILGIVVVIAICLPLTARVLTSSEMMPGIELMVGAILLGTLMLLVVPYRVTRWIKGLQLWGRLCAKLIEQVQQLRRPRLILLGIGLSVAIHMLSIVMILMIARALGLALAPWEAAALIPLVLFFALLPISIAGWGVREGAMVLLLGYVGISTADALSVSVVYGLTGLAAGVFGGLIWLVTGRAASGHDL